MELMELTAAELGKRIQAGEVMACLFYTSRCV